MDTAPPPYSEATKAATQPPAAPAPGYQQGGYNQGYYNQAYYPPPPNPYPQNPAATTAVYVTALGNCPSCRVANLIPETDAGALCCIVFMAIFFFPVGLLCLLCLPSIQQFRCPNCGYMQ